MSQLNYAEQVRLVLGISSDTRKPIWGELTRRRFDTAMRDVINQLGTQPNRSKFSIVRSDKSKPTSTYKAVLAIYKHSDFPKESLVDAARGSSDARPTA